MRRKYFDMKVSTQDCETVYGVPCGFKTSDDCENCREIYEGELEEVESEFNKKFEGYDIKDSYEIEYKNNKYERYREIRIEAIKSN